MTNTRGKKTFVPASKKRKGAASSWGPTNEIWHPFLQFPPGPQEELFQILRACPLGSTLQLQTVMAEHDDPGIVQFCLGGLVCQLSVPEFGATLGLYMDEFLDTDIFPSLHRHIHHPPSVCWSDLQPATGVYDPSRSKASVLPPPLHYLYALLAHTLMGRLLNTIAQSSSLNLIGQMSPQGIQSMLHMRMIERWHGFNPPQYRLARATDKDDDEDILDDIPPVQDEPPFQPPPRHQPVHAAASLFEVSDHLHRFEQYCTQRFNSIGATLQQFCQHFHISPPKPPPQDPAVGEDF
ncbi:hypothetical protein GOBAR_AA00096 [Gossypium barbadense]|uniref:Uncharacterized protein n=1 Tax=Gossypium barbadense TaxID=3634 RepID=A0A2P5YY53_GOSBA|nr:hypothetical protein GOBAR_AA00096 [Gossypium barbadense]